MSLELETKHSTFKVHLRQTSGTQANSIQGTTQLRHIGARPAAMTMRHSIMRLVKVDLWAGPTLEPSGDTTHAVYLLRLRGIPSAGQVLAIALDVLQPYATIFFVWTRETGGETNNCVGFRDSHEWTLKDAPIIAGKPGAPTGQNMLGLGFFGRVNQTTGGISLSAFIVVDYEINQKTMPDRAAEFSGIQQFEDSHDHHNDSY